MRKYKINECMENLTVSQYRIVYKQVLQTIGKTKSTFNKYCKLQINDPEDIPYLVVRKLEILFDLKPGQLANYETKGKTYQELMEEDLTKSGC